MKTYNHSIEEWWRHNGAYDRKQASGIPYHGKDIQSYLKKTDSWWNHLTESQKLKVYNEFFEEC